ncbi:hypothetical protein V1525DRAFT_423342 [Lipomyces kononenkoae]|uniref:Uncharacterized protein n=1 Tax=Lipomyces kononenkoae TaxID=34357 RepID=A0ACC3TB14_LIPKO
MDANSFRNSWVLFTNLSHLRGPQPLKVLHLPSVAGQMGRRRISIAWWPESYEKSNWAPVAVPPDISLRNDKNEMSNYAKPLDLLKDNTPEQRLDVHLPYSMYLDLEKSWSKYPRLSYNSFDEVATVITIQRAIHEVATSMFNIEVGKRVDEYLSIHSPQEADRIVFTGSMTEMGSGNDGSFFYDDNNGGRLVLRVVVEAGHSEHYGRLPRDKDMWVKGMNTKAVVLMCHKESQRFKNPHTVWFEKLSESFIEVWRMGMKDPVRSWLIKDGRTYERLPTTVGLKISDFLGDRELSAANVPNCDVCFDAHGYLRQLMYGTLLTARVRAIERGDR